MKISTIQTLKVLYILTWIIFIGVCIDAGGAVFNTIYTLLINSYNAKTFWVDNDLSALYKYGNMPFFLQTSLICMASVIKARIFYLLMKIQYEKKLNMSQPFNDELGLFVFRISYLCLFVGFVSFIAAEYKEWLVDHSVPMPEIQKLRIGGADVWLFMGVTLYVIAQIFKRGIEIQSENDLTV